MPVASSGNGRLRAAWQALRHARWPAARDGFAAEVAARPTAAAYEGLSWAAWWLDDAQAVFTARERAFALYRAEGDVASAARMAIWLAADSLDFHGAAAAANGWLARARRLLAPLPDGADHGWLAVHEGHIANLNGDWRTAARLGTRAAQLGRATRVADLEMLGLALRGVTLVSRGRVGEGMQCLDEATVIALREEATIPISSAWTCCFMVTACAAVLDFSRAREWCSRIEAFAERYGSRYMLGFCRAEYGTVFTWSGQWAEAERLLTAAVGDFARSRPAFTTWPLTALAELRRRQGRAAEALDLLDQAGPSPTASLCRARLALARGEAECAADLVERSLRRSAGNRSAGRVQALEVLLRVRVARGEAAVATLQELRRTARQLGTDAVQAIAARAGAGLATARGDHRRAQRLLEDAADLFARAAAPHEAALARVALAEVLRAQGRRQEATVEVDASVDELQRLGAMADAERARALRAAWENDGTAASDGVTLRERQVLSLLARGLSNRAIAQQLHRSEHTVHRHVSNILRKLDLPTRAAAAAYAAGAGLAPGMARSG